METYRDQATRPRLHWVIVLSSKTIINIALEGHGFKQKLVKYIVYWLEYVNIELCNIYSLLIELHYEWKCWSTDKFTKNDLKWKKINVICT